MISESSVFPLRLMFNLLDRSYPSNFGRCGGISPILDNLEKNIFEGGLEIKKLSPNLNDGDAVVTFFLRTEFFIFFQDQKIFFLNIHVALYIYFMYNDNLH